MPSWLKISGFTDCSNLSVQNHSRLVDVQKFITFRPFIVLGSVDNRWKTDKLFYIFYVEFQI
jgi:hypothetical protein